MKHFYRFLFLTWSLCALLGTPACQAQALSAPSFGISPDDGASLARGIQAASQAGARRVVVPPGEYRLPAPPPENGSNLAFGELRNLEIDAQGATILFPDSTKGGIYLARCENVTLRGATLRNARIPFSQGRIESISPDRLSVVMRVDEGYPADLDDARFFAPSRATYLFEGESGAWKVGGPELWNPTQTRLDERRFALGFGPPVSPRMEVGDALAWRGLGGHALTLLECRAMKIEDVTIQFAGLFAVVEAHGEGGHSYTRVRVEPGPRPAGETRKPLLSSNADALHSASVRIGPTIRDCFFTRMPDDGIAIHGEFQMVRRVTGNNIVAMRGEAGAPYRIGDEIGVVAQDGTPKATATVRGVTVLEANFLPPIETPWQAFKHARQFFQLELDRALEVREHDLITNRNAQGAGFTIQNNTLLDHRARGVMLKSSDGLIENNRFEGTTFVAILLEPQPWWGESDYSRNVTIRANTFKRVGTYDFAAAPRLGTVCLLATGDSPLALGHQNIRIENNIFQNNDGINILLDGVQGAILRGNRFESAQTTTFAEQRGNPPSRALVWIDRAENVTIEHNDVAQSGVPASKLLEITARAGTITGAQTGFSPR